MKDNYDLSDLDAILAEFSVGADEDEAPLPTSDLPDAEPDLPDKGPGVPDSFREGFGDLPELASGEPASPPIEGAPFRGAGEQPRALGAKADPEEAAEPELPPLYARGESAPKPRSLFHRAPREESLRAAAEEKPARVAKRFSKAKKAPQEAADLPQETPEPVEEPVKPPRPPRTKFVLPLALRILLGLVSLGLLALVLSWTLFNLHPASDTLSYEGGDAKLRLTAKLDVYANNASADAIGDLAYIRKIYTLQESDIAAPSPDPNAFGTTDDLAEVQAVIDRAAGLLDGQSLIFSFDSNFVPGTPFRYYLDDTIFVLAWQEYIDNRLCTFAEVKVAHGSQIRRKLSGDSYSSGVQLYASTMAKAANAVVAINGDFYEYRKLGITVYQRTLYRNKPAYVDTCFFTADGDLLFSRAGELMGEGEAQNFVDENDVVFAVAFGPVLVDNGELQEISSYPIGEINTMYSRSCIAMKGDLHYLLMTINWDPHNSERPRATIPELGRYVYAMGVDKAYTLDGGQTAEIVMMGSPINHVDFGSERNVSDIIYFATAIPEEVRS